MNKIVKDKKHMNFKQLEMVGFKSFADPIKLTFSDGITAIVGPNGCGKSNVADAIRWVLGEQSSKMLRGSVMQDVIFKGTEKRKSLSFCEVSLCFDNTNRIFKVDYDEIVITRKLYRSGDSEYLINRTPCRLKDIIDLLHDSGIGKSGYSIIGQGKVEEIINSKPEDRRAIFEEAAGISKFKFKKVEAERKLARTQDNLTRINDIISEIDKQLAPLKRQSETAKIYLELKEKLKILEINAYIYQYDYASENKAVIQQKIDAIVEEMNLRQKDLDSTINDYNETFDEINGLDDHIAKTRDKILELTVGLEKQAGETNLIMERAKNIEVEVERLSAELSKAETKKEELDDNAYKNQIAINNKKERLYTLKHNASDLEEKYNSVFSELESGELATKEAQKRLFASIEKIGDTKAQISALQVEKSQYEKEIAEINSTDDELKIQLQDKTREYNEHDSEMQKLFNDKNSFKFQLDDLLNKQTAKQNEIKYTENEINEITSNILSLNNRKKLLLDMQKEYEGFNGSVKRLLTDAEQNRDLKNKIVGVLANLITVPQTYQTAIEMALGSAVQNIVTRTDEDAKQLINYLKQMEYGRVTFLPINSVKPRFFDRANEKYLTGNGCFGLASQLITYDKSISNIISSLLGGTAIVNNINNAVSLAKQSGYAFKIVTLEGDIINPQGSITGGSKKSQFTNLLSRDNNIKLCDEQIAKLEQQKQQKVALLNDLSQQQTALNNEVLDITEKLRKVEISHASISEVVKNDNTAVVEMEGRQNKLASDLAKAKQMIISIDNQLNKLSEDPDINISELSMGENSQFDDLKNKKEQYTTELTSLKVEIASIESELVSLQQEKERLESELNFVNDEIHNIAPLLEKNRQQLAIMKINVTHSQSSIEANEISEELGKTKQKLEELNSSKTELQSKLRLLEEQRMNLTAEVNRLQDKKYQQDLNLTKVDTDIETMQERVWTEYEVTYATAMEYKQEMFNVKDALPEISRLKKEINKLGHVNVNAIEDYKLLLERHGSMYEQAQDLIKAEDDLKQIIRELSAEMKERFETEFKKINDNFGRVFQTLFGGGKAKLELVQSDDVLEAGVDIIAEPPGKKLSNITLLSGGEKSLTAIAILFAILQLKPMPFCLLDEIEAALDEANVERFAKYLKNYSSDTQFIVITHKKPTMEHADVLYGVTMEEKGVSKIVSVKLSEAIKNLERN